jgi:glucosamine kinase
MRALNQEKMVSHGYPYRNLYVGVDGGATKCIVRLEDEQGKLLGRETGGPASLRFAASEVWHSILTTLNKILQQQDLSSRGSELVEGSAEPINNIHLHAGMGLAGSELSAAYQAFLHSPHPFKTFVVTSDARIACLGAHGAADGAVIIAGTGMVGYQIQQSVTTKVGGFGFPHDDEGGGAWLGLQAVKKTVQWLDGRIARSGLAEAIYQHFDNDAAILTAWANNANATLFAELAPFVIEQSKQQDVVACELLQQAANAIDQVATALQQAQLANTQPLPCALVGSITPFLEPYLSNALRARLVSASLPPDAGAILLVRNANGKK